ncbi:GDSL family lipase [Paenibacillus sp. CAA11]|uniref:SGNH/GDSL hydrolase family protein n=1 Tax=Paenibacillus sp. CAA11 TaxID=1532905 RepID=UPI000D3C29E3|nr:SGNH/GDSL hydrolase family protein [Paenibacillus sp. CAA11]AWB45454.1 GDSL family lipase [Paenibacillus sp. CAA11]
MKLQLNDTLLITGDSITDCGRDRPFGESGGLGNGYASQVFALLKAVYPQLHIRVLNTGVGGDTTLELEERWETDVKNLKPDWLSIMIGTNDVWRQIGKPEAEQSLTAYENRLRKLIEDIKPSLKGLILMTPYLLESNKNDRMRSLMDQCGVIVKKLAEEYDAVFVDTQAAFDAVASDIYLAELSFNWDRVHPDGAGHMVLARAFLNAIGFNWEGK